LGYQFLYSWWAIFGEEGQHRSPFLFSVAFTAADFSAGLSFGRTSGETVHQGEVKG